MKRKFPLLLFSAVLIIVVLAMAFLPGLTVPVAGEESASSLVLYDEVTLDSASMATLAAPATYNVAEPVSAGWPKLQTMVAVLILSTITAVVVANKRFTIFSFLDRIAHYMQINSEARFLGRRCTKFIMPA